MSVQGQTEKSGRATGKSVLPSRTDIVSPACQVRKVPIAVIDLGLRASSQPFAANVLSDRLLCLIVEFH